MAQIIYIHLTSSKGSKIIIFIKHYSMKRNYSNVISFAVSSIEFRWGSFFFLPETHKKFEGLYY